jgi:hypothetical protein
LPEVVAAHPLPSFANTSNSRKPHTSQSQKQERLRRPRFIQQLGGFIALVARDDPCGCFIPALKDEVFRASDK